MRLKDLSVLLVEDDVDNREAMELTLRSEGAFVESVASAKHALALLGARYKPNVVVSDLGLPHEGGCSMMRKIRKMGITTPAVAMTGGTGDVQAAFLAGFQLHVSKPFRRDVLLRIVETLGRR
jgi:CheY-like chemotaxis protein